MGETLQYSVARFAVQWRYLQRSNFGWAMSKTNYKIPPQSLLTQQQINMKQDRHCKMSPFSLHCKVDAYSNDGDGGLSCGVPSMWI